MDTVSQSPLHLWNICKKTKFGKYLYSFIIGLQSPYNYSIKPTIEYFDKTECICSINDTFFIRNPFQSIHAIALTNLGELTSGLIMLECLHGKNKNGIVTDLNCKYHKKARGKITAICKLDSNCVLLHKTSIKINMFNTQNELICSMRCTWNIKQ
jgi:acyl-coenzyme A thioesterase PaaI-like protein